MLREEDPAVFKYFVLWLYTGHLFKLKPGEKLDLLVIKACILGDRLGAPSFHDCMMTTLLVKYGSQHLLTDADTIRYIYDNSIVDSP